jgi:hypothetical protein
LFPGLLGNEALTKHLRRDIVRLRGPSDDVDTAVEAVRERAQATATSQRLRLDHHICLLATVALGKHAGCNICGLRRCAGD